MKAVTAVQMRRIDEIAIRQFGIPSIILMENAGIACAVETLKSKPRCVSVVSGRGNNGGDGFVVARHLHNHGIDVRVFYAGSPKSLTHDSLIHFNILRKLGVPLERLDRAQGLTKLKTSIRTSDVVVDAIFGTGLSKPVSGLWSQIISLINESAGRIVSVDTPSGLNVDTGLPMGAAVRAHTTVTFGLAKKGFRKARHFTGRVVVADISLPRVLLMGRS